MNQYYPFPVSPLPYSYVSLMPRCDPDTLYYHYEHFAGQIRQLNQLVAQRQLTELTLDELFCQDLNLPAAQAAQVKSLSGSVYAHQLYFDSIYSSVSRLPDNLLTRKLIDTYGSLEQFKKLLTEAAYSITGSGWVWLIMEGGEPHIATTGNNSVVSLNSVTPIFSIDMWEHAYFPLYQFDKAAYLNNWFELVNWDRADQRYQSIQHSGLPR